MSQRRSPMQSVRSRAYRHGITLLEILISIGVLAVGLLGVLALIPAASQQAKSGIEQDAAAQLGRSAFRIMNIRWPDDTAIFNPAGPQDQFYCIDPLGQIFNSELSSLVSVPSARDSTTSTTPIAGVVSANRVVLRDNNLPGLNKAITNPLVINEIFRSKDDLDFGDFASNTNPAPNPPQQIALSDSGVGLKRYAKGNLSWFATVVPRNTGFNTVSVVIVKGRTGVEYTEPVSSGLPIVGGLGEIEVPISNNGEEDWSKLKSGQWIMLTNNTSNPALGTAEWYRVQGIGRVDNDNDGIDDHRVMTVVGPNWMFTSDTQLVFIPNVVAVYSRSRPR